MTDRPDANLIQMYCDGECTAEQSAQVERQLAADPELQKHVRQQTEFNANLRRHILKSNQSVMAPAGLLEQVKATLDQASQSPSIAGRIHSTTTKSSRFAAIFDDPRRGNVFAIAATLLIVAGAVLYGIFGRSIDDVTPANPTDVFSQAALFAEAEHGQCAGDATTLSKKSQFTDIIEAERMLSHWVDAPVRVTNLADLGYEFVGAGQCNLPTTVRSGHLMYRKMGVKSGPTPMVSVFVFPNRGQCGGNLCKGMDCNQWYLCANDKCVHKVLRSTDGRLVYLLVCCVDGDIDQIAQAITADLGHGQ